MAELQRASEEIARLKVANDALQAELDRSITDRRDWTRDLLDTVVADHDLIWERMQDGFSEGKLFEDMLRQRGFDLRLSDIGHAQDRHRKVLFADEYTDGAPLQHPGPQVVRLLHLVFGYAEPTEEAPPEGTLLKLRFVETCFMYTLRRRSSRSNANILLVYVYLLWQVQRCQGVEFAMACSILANVCAQFPISRDGVYLSDSFVSDALNTNADSHTSRDRLGKLCMLRLALALQDVDSRNATIRLAGFDASHVQGLGFLWDTSLPDMVHGLWMGEARQVDSHDKSSVDWAFCGKVKDRHHQTLDLCIFRNSKHSTNLLLVKVYDTVMTNTQHWIASTCELKRDYDEIIGPKKPSKHVSQYGPNEHDHLIFWDETLEGNHFPEEEEEVFKRFMREAEHKDSAEVLAEKTNAWMAEMLAELRANAMSDSD